MEKKNIFLLNGQNLSCQNLEEIVSRNGKIDISPEARKKVQKSRDIIHNMMSQPDRIVYGINTGFGDFADKIISHENRAQLQINLIRSHSVGVGNSIPEKNVKRMMILRINTLAKGRSGISMENLDKYIQAYNAGFIPYIPEKGTVGASGDLAPLSHLTLAMIGEGMAWDKNKNSFQSAKKVMESLNLTPIYLKEKEGLALINGTQFMCSLASETVFRAKNILLAAQKIFAFAFQIYGLDYNYLSEQTVKKYGTVQPSIGKSIQNIRKYLDNEPSQLHHHRSQQFQGKLDCYSMLQGFENLASLEESIKFCQRLIEEEMNSATDNPLVYSKDDFPGQFEEDKLISAGNFHGEYVAKASDFLSMALFSLARFSQSRNQRYVNHRTSLLPGFLIEDGGLNSGYMIIQYTSAALLSESKVLVKPASADSIITSAGQEDHVSMGGFAARKSLTILENTAYILGIELILALQAADMIQKKLSKNLESIRKKARNHIKYLKEDRYFGEEIKLAKDWVMNGLRQLDQN